VTRSPEMRAYYRERAGEYDDWWLGRGRFAERDRPGWDDEVEELLAVLAALPPRRTLDVACGTGFLTQALPGEVTGLDQSAEVLEVARDRLPEARLVHGDALPLPFADGAFERVTTGHFYGHLLPGEREEFLAEARRVAPELVIVDSALRDDTPPERWEERVLDDGSTHRVFKRYFTPESLAAEIGDLRTLHRGRWFLAVAAPP
jgi:ubiquinone/menaquinone biosynthesis C-methylase UbiE